MSDKIPVRACVRSGFCCKKTPCGFGGWNNARTQCAYLGVDDKGLHLCEKFDEISLDPTSSVSPAFGAGCCMPLGNTDRERIIKEHHNGKTPIVMIDNFL